MLGLLDSSRVTLAIVFGIPVAIAVVVALGIRRSTPALLLVGGAVIVAAIAALAGWAVFRPGTGTAGSTAASPGVGTTSRPPGPDLSCTPSGTRLQETVQGIAYQKTCLAAPAGQPVTIQFVNRDAGTPHNIHLFSADPSTNPGARSLFTGSLVTGPGVATYRVPSLPAGRYFFHCDIHPNQMRGGFVVG